MTGDPDHQLTRVLARRERHVAHARREVVLFGAAARCLPFGWRRALAALSPRLGLLLINDGDIVVDDYLDHFRVHVQAVNPIERAMLSGAYAREIVDVIESHVRTGFVCFDIGANVGALTLPMCRSAGASGRVFSFEPGEKFFRRLQANLALNPDVAPIAAPYMLGLSDSITHMNWAEDPASPGNAWLLAETGVPVEVTTVDAFVEANGIQRLDFIKIDVEGMEIEVLRGARASLARFRPTIVFETLMEFEAIRGRAIRKEVEDLLLGLRYEIFGITGRGARNPARYPNLPFNCLALPREA